MYQKAAENCMADFIVCMSIGRRTKGGLDEKLVWQA